MADLQTQCVGVKLDMRVDKAGDEEIIVSVAWADFVLHIKTVGAGGVNEGLLRDGRASCRERV